MSHSFVTLKHELINIIQIIDHYSTCCEQTCLFTAKAQVEDSVEKCPDPPIDTYT